jgi:hypothetical protein
MKCSSLETGSNIWGSSPDDFSEDAKHFEPKWVLPRKHNDSLFSTAVKITFFLRFTYY